MVPPEIAKEGPLFSSSTMEKYLKVNTIKTFEKKEERAISGIKNSLMPIEKVLESIKERKSTEKNAFVRKTYNSGLTFLYKKENKGNFINVD